VVGGSPIDGLDEVAYLIKETVFSLTELLKKRAIIGARPIGCEMARSFERFGCVVRRFLSVGTAASTTATLIRCLI
jgi:pyruvate/2-oxoglutarate dehydrogenase complex dihydrolipoamide dehydrogenase (E3) component